MPFTSPPRGEGVRQLPLLTSPEPRLGTAGPLWPFGSIHLGSVERRRGLDVSLQAGVAGRRKVPAEGAPAPATFPCLAQWVCVDTDGWRGTRRGPWQVWGCVSKRFNRRASCLAGLFSRSSVHGSPWLGVKGKFLLQSSKTQGFSRASSMGKDAGLALTIL